VKEGVALVCCWVERVHGGGSLVPVTGTVLPLFLRPLLAAFVLGDEFGLSPGLGVVLLAGASPPPAPLPAAEIPAAVHRAASPLGFGRGLGSARP